jgi:tetratricopeptide (TPR) repeat protein
MQTALAQKITMDERRKKILAIVEEELSEVERLSRQQNNRVPETVFRKSELYLEKARLWREIENEKYLAISPEERRSVNKRNFFKHSNRFFGSANDSAEILIKRFPNYSGIGEVYYILGFNHKELGNIEAAKKYFKLSTAKTKGNSKVGHKAMLASADYAYNDREYSAAIPLYEASLKNVDEKWWTKDAFNLAWSYYRMKNNDKAINLMKEIHRKSSNPKYIDMRSIVERDIGVFFIDAGKIKEAISFYEGLGLNYSEQFIKIASTITTQGRFSQAEALLEQAAKTEKRRDLRIEVLLAQLNLYDKYNKVSEHLTVSKELVKLHKDSPLAQDQLKSLVYHVDKKAAELQKATASTLYKDVKKIKDQKSKTSIEYFELSAALTPGKKDEKVFFQGETAYAAGKYGMALGFYIEAFDGAQAANDKKTMDQSIEGLLSSLGQSELSPITAEKFYVPVYTRYLIIDSKSDRAHSIFVKLFNSQYNKDISGAEKTMADFARAFPKDFKTQEGMLAKVMEHYRKKKDYGAVKSYVSRINAGEFKVSSKYAEALRSLMTKIQIEGVQRSLDKGEKAVALKGYHQIYESAESTPKARVNAAYNLAALYHDMGNSAQSYTWSVTAVKEMETKDVSKFVDSLLGISSGLFLRQHFSQSSDLSYRILAKLCKDDSSNKAVSYKNAVFIALANGDLDKALEIRNFGKECHVPETAITEVSLELIKDLGKARRWEYYEKLLSELETNSKNYPMLIAPYEELKLQYLKIGDGERAREVDQKQNNFFHVGQTQKLDFPVETLDLLATKMLSGVINKKKKIEQIQLKFPENEFNSAVKQKLVGLDQLTAEVNTVQKLGSGRGIVEAYKQVIAAYEDFGKELQEFTPEGKGPEYVESFRKAMADVYTPILANARKLRSEVKKLIKENKVLSMSNYEVLYPGADGQKRFFATRSSVLMERGGVR